MSRRPITVISRDPPGRQLIGRFIKFVRQGKSPETSDLVQLADGLQKILDGAPANRAFQLTFGQGNKRTFDRLSRDKWIVTELEELRDYYGRGGFESAKELVAQRFGLSAATVTEIWKNYKSRQKSGR